MKEVETTGYINYGTFALKTVNGITRVEFLEYEQHEQKEKQCLQCVQVGESQFLNGGNLVALKLLKRAWALQNPPHNVVLDEQRKSDNISILLQIYHARTSHEKFNEIKKAMESIKNPRGKSGILITLAGIEMQKDPNKAEEYYQQALALTEEREGKCEIYIVGAQQFIRAYNNAMKEVTQPIETTLRQKQGQLFEKALDYLIEASEQNLTFKQLETFSVILLPLIQSINQLNNYYLNYSMLVPEYLEKTQKGCLVLKYFLGKVKLMNNADSNYIQEFESHEKIIDSNLKFIAPLLRKLREEQTITKEYDTLAKGDYKEYLQAMKKEKDTALINLCQTAVQVKDVFQKIGTKASPGNLDSIKQDLEKAIGYLISNNNTPANYTQALKALTPFQSVSAKIIDEMDTIRIAIINNSTKNADSALSKLGSLSENTRFAVDKLYTLLTICVHQQQTAHNRSPGSKAKNQQEPPSLQHVKQQMMVSNNIRQLLKALYMSATRTNIEFLQYDELKQFHRTIPEITPALEAPKRRQRHKKGGVPASKTKKQSEETTVQHGTSVELLNPALQTPTAQPAEHSGELNKSSPASVPIPATNQAATQNFVVEGITLSTNTETPSTKASSTATQQPVKAVPQPVTLITPQTDENASVPKSDWKEKFRAYLAEGDKVEDKKAWVNHTPLKKATNEEWAALKQGLFSSHTRRVLSTTSPEGAWER